MYKKILVPLDGSELAECVSPHVESFTKGCGIQNVVFLRVVELFHMISSYYGPGSGAEDINRINEDNKAAAENYLSRLVERTKYNDVTIQSEIIIGKAADVIADYAAKNSVDLIAIATHGRSGVSRWD